MKRVKRPAQIPVSVTYDLKHMLRDAPKEGPKVLLLDVETSMMVAYVFGTWKQNIGCEDIIQDWNLLSFCAKWAGVPTTLYQSLRFQANPVNDFGLCKSLHALLREADVVVAHNGKRFDMRKIRARMAHNRLPPIPDVRVIDTLLESRKQFGFTSQKLIWLSEHFGPDGQRKNSHGKFPGKKLWHECQAGNPAAWDEMEEYNIPDVVSMEGMWMELRPWYQGAQNLAIFSPSHAGHTCPNCTSTRVKRDGLRRTQVGVYQQYKCKDCGAYSRSRVQSISREDRQHVLMN